MDEEIKVVMVLGCLVRRGFIFGIQPSGKHVETFVAHCGCFGALKGAIGVKLVRVPPGAGVIPYLYGVLFEPYLAEPAFVGVRSLAVWAS